MVANTHIFHSGNNATKGHSSPPPLKWGSACGCWWGRSCEGKGLEVQRSSYPGCLSFPSSTLCHTHPFALSKHVLISLTLLGQSLLTSLSLHMEKLSQQLHLKMFLHWFRTLPWVWTCFPTLNAVSLFLACKREWAISLWRQENNLKFPYQCL